MENIILHFPFFKKLVKSKSNEYKTLIQSSTIEQQRAILSFVQLYADKKIGKENKLLQAIKKKRQISKDTISVLLKNRVLIQSILCCALKILMRMATFYLADDGQV